MLDPFGLEMKTPVVDRDSLGERKVLIGYPRGDVSPERATECCKKYAKSLKRQGWVQCCDGQQITCAYIDRSASIQADVLIASCIDVHEEEHFDDVIKCREGSCRVPDWWLEPHQKKERDERECEAYKAQVECMRDKVGQCDDQVCRDAMTEFLEKVIEYAEEKHGCKDL